MQVLNKLIFFSAALLANWLRRNRSEFWLIGENRGRLSFDNGHAFYEYTNYRKRNVYLVVRRDHMPHGARKEGYVTYGSLRHAWYLGAAGVLIYTHTPRDLMYASLFPILRRGKRSVFLKHGITAFKQFNKDYRERCNDSDLLIVSSEHERAVIHRELGTDIRRIAITGFARYDRYDPLANGESIRIKEVLFMPTWRDWIGDREFMQSDLYLHTSELLASPQLRRLLDSCGVRLTFLLHVNIREYIGHYSGIEGSSIDVLYADQVNIQELIIASDLLITDYSSISWDFLYLRRPVLFYRFDLDDYLAYRGSCVDLNNPDTLFGYTAYDMVSVINTLTNLIHTEVSLPERDLKIREKWFQYSDKLNCQRIYQRIQCLQEQ